MGGGAGRPHLHAPGERLVHRLLDRQVTLSCALGNEHYEMSAYQGLIIPATAMGAADVVALLQPNLDQEIHTSEELQSMLQEIVAA